MVRSKQTIGTVFVSLGLAQSAWAQPSDPVCGSQGGGPTICVRFDNLLDEPQPNADFVFAFDGSNIPSVTLLRGTDTQTTREWRIWCYDGNGDPADIGAISSPGAYNYSVKILNPSGQAGARNLGSAVLSPSGSHHSSLAAGSLLSGDLSDDITVKTFGGSGGVLSLAANAKVNSQFQL